ncbi:CdaR family protein [Desmospora profundinema]|uniref:YbbR domain-containing protein n=1 Tax=Desmospora profundinema TaxID=1571184 RepID=A0ABU1IS24_9BACL|nr:CdaR family protein [Desmospora profundinema]MDR6227600.1 YbbR domain-containing protein [Desmospora profundinema]
MDKWLQNNTVVKLVAVVLAIMLWTSVNDASLRLPRDSNVANTISNVTLEARYDETRFELVEMPSSVNLTLRGSPFSLNLVSPDRYRAYVDLREMTEGKHTDVPVRLEGIPRNVEAQVRPARVDVVLEEKLQKEMPVEVEVIGKPEADYQLGEPVSTPNRVLVRGTEAQLNRVKAVKAVVNVAGAKDTIKETVSIQVYGEKGWMDGVEVTPEVVDVNVPIASPNAVVPLKMDIAEYPPKGYAINEIKTNIDKVTVYGSKRYVSALEVYTGPELDLSEAKSDRTFELPIPVTGGAAKVDPERVKIEVDIVKESKKRFSDVPIAIKGLKQGLEASFQEDETVDLTLLGASDRLDQVDQEDLEAFIDVSNLSAGEHEVPLQLNRPAYLRWDEEGQMITVRITR